MSRHFSEVFRRDKHRCVYCGRDMLVDFETLMMIQEDHLVPRSKGGLDEANNIVTACSVCNMLKGNYTPPHDYKPENRGAYIACIRKHIMSRRAERMADFVSWTHPDVPEHS